MASPQPAPEQPAAPETHQAAQVALALLVAAALAKLWPHLLADPSKVPAFKAAVAQEVRQHAAASATLAVRHYAGQRQAAGVTAPFRPQVAELPSVEEIGAMVDEALAGLDLRVPDELTVAQDRLATMAGSTVLDTGGRTLLGNIGQDRAARGYARVPEAGACAFCLMLASRGAVYKHDRSGGRGDSFAASNARFHDGKVPSSIKVHDNCECQPEPVFGAYEPTARARAGEALWVLATRGRSGQRARDAYRAAVDGFTNDKHGSPYFTEAQAAQIAALRRQLS